MCDDGSIGIAPTGEAIFSSPAGGSNPAGPYLYRVLNLNYPEISIIKRFKFRGCNFTVTVWWYFFCFINYYVSQSVCYALRVIKYLYWKYFVSAKGKMKGRMNCLVQITMNFLTFNVYIYNTTEILKNKCFSLSLSIFY